MEGEIDNRSLPYLRFPSEAVQLCRNVIELDPYLSKPLLLLMRYGNMPINEYSTLAVKVQPAIAAIADMAIGKHHISSVSYKELVMRIYSKLPDLFDPVVRGCIVQMCETFRLPEEDEDRLRTEALEKETSVFRRIVWNRPELNWDALWNGGHLVPGIEMTPWSSSDIGFATQKAMNSYRYRIIYPSMSRKLLPTRARQWLRERGNSAFEDWEVSTPAELEKFYLIHGVHFLGPCEVKQRWYMHGLVPRTYAVAGETAYTFSKYLKDIWNILWNSFIPTERFNRVDISRIRKSSAKYSFAMYDLTTFTSNFETHRDFVLALSRNMNIEITVADGRKGFTQLSLKSLLEEYANYLCRDVHWYSEVGSLKGMPEEIHAVAGLLGVIGNIASCGVAHGMFLRTLVHSLEEEGVAGDDAIFVYLISEGWRKTTGIIRGNLGELNDDKVYNAEEKDAVYLKRGVEQGPGGLSLNEYVFFPKLIFLSKNDLRRYRESKDMLYGESLLERIFVSSLGSTYRSAGRVTFDPNPLKSLLSSIYDILGLPISGHCPGIAKQHTVPVWAEDLFVPSIERLGDPEYVSNQYLDAFEGEGRFPEVDLEYDPVQFEVTAGSVFRAKGSRTLTYLYRLGILEREKVMVEVSGFVAIEKLMRIAGKGRPSNVYEYTVKDSVMLSFVHSDLRVVSGCPITGCGIHRSEYGEVNAAEMASFSETSSIYSMEEGEILEDVW